MFKNIITISVPKDTTKEQIKLIREQYSKDNKVNIIISGNSDPKMIIRNFLCAALDK